MPCINLKFVVLPTEIQIDWNSLFTICSIQNQQCFEGAKYFCVTNNQEDNTHFLYAFRAMFLSSDWMETLKSNRFSVGMNSGLYQLNCQIFLNDPFQYEIFHAMLDQANHTSLNLIRSLYGKALKELDKKLRRTTIIAFFLNIIYNFWQSNYPFWLVQKLIYNAVLHWRITCSPALNWEQGLWDLCRRGTVRFHNETLFSLSLNFPLKLSRNRIIAVIWKLIQILIISDAQY